MQVLMEINDWANRCGYFFNAYLEKDISMNNGYNCRHPECDHIEQGVGSCHAGACPFGFEADEEDCINFGMEYEEANFIIVDITEEDYNENIMWIRKTTPKRESIPKINIEIFVDSNEDLHKFKTDIYKGLDDTLAIIFNDKTKYELYAEYGILNMYKSEKNDNGEFETTDKFHAYEYMDEMEDLETFVQKLIKLFL